MGKFLTFSRKWPYINSFSRRRIIKPLWKVERNQGFLESIFIAKRRKSHKSDSSESATKAKHTWEMCTGPWESLKRTPLLVNWRLRPVRDWRSSTISHIYAVPGSARISNNSNTPCAVPSPFRCFLSLHSISWRSHFRTPCMHCLTIGSTSYFCMIWVIT